MENLNSQITLLISQGFIAQNIQMTAFLIVLQVVSMEREQHEMEASFQALIYNILSEAKKCQLCEVCHVNRSSDLNTIGLNLVTSIYRIPTTSE